VACIHNQDHMKHYQWVVNVQFIPNYVAAEASCTMFNSFPIRNKTAQLSCKAYHYPMTFRTSHWFCGVSHLYTSCMTTQKARRLQIFSWQITITGEWIPTRHSEKKTYYMKTGNVQSKWENIEEKWLTNLLEFQKKWKKKYKE